MSVLQYVKNNNNNNKTEPGIDIMLRRAMLCNRHVSYIVVIQNYIENECPNPGRDLAAQTFQSNVCKKLNFAFFLKMYLAS